MVAKVGLTLMTNLTGNWSSAMRFSIRIIGRYVSLIASYSQSSSRKRGYSRWRT